MTSLRVSLLLLAWFSAILQIVFGQSVEMFSNIGAVLLGLFLLIILPRLKWDSYLILIMLGVMGWFLLNGLPTQELLFSGGRFILIFVALIATMTLSKA